ncbi:MAG: hypothetical protein HC779_00385 [Phyllobacteriaceae bacterium]|nr:hypothetical protein [Phyllobacteriaceae bacterium]
MVVSVGLGSFDPSIVELEAEYSGSAGSLPFEIADNLRMPFWPTIKLKASPIKTKLPFSGVSGVAETSVSVGTGFDIERARIDPRTAIADFAGGTWELGAKVVGGGLNFAPRGIREITGAVAWGLGGLIPNKAAENLSRAGLYGAFWANGLKAVTRLPAVADTMSLSVGGRLPTRIAVDFGATLVNELRQNPADFGNALRKSWNGVGSYLQKDPLLGLNFGIGIDVPVGGAALGVKTSTTGLGNGGLHFCAVQIAIFPHASKDPVTAVGGLANATVICMQDRQVQ